MWELIEKKIGVNVPREAIKMMGNIQMHKDFLSYYEKLYRRFESLMTEEQKSKIADIKPYLVNKLFLPIVITKMIEENVTFLEAVKLSEENIKESITKEDVEAFFQDMISAISLLGESEPNAIFDDTLMVSINFSFGIYCKVMEHKLFNIIDCISEEKVTRKILEEKLILPLKADICNFYDNTGESLNTSWIEDIYSSVDNYYILIPLALALSVVLKKAISRNVTFSVLLEEIEIDDLAMEIIDELSNNEYGEIKERYSQILKSIYKFTK